MEKGLDVKRKKSKLEQESACARGRGGGKRRERGYFTWSDTTVLNVLLPVLTKCSLSPKKLNPPDCSTTDM